VSVDPAPRDPPPRRGRRDNGLVGTEFVPLADVDPRVGEYLLDVLKFNGVPAYLEPSSDTDPYTRTVALPSPPTDRLWVAREQRSAARRIVEAEAESAGRRAGAGGAAGGGAAAGDDRPSHGLTDEDEELAWREIVESFEADSTAPVPPWPVEEDAERRSARSGSVDTDDSGTADAAGSDGRGAAANDGASDGAADAAIADDEGHYVPPPPPPVPRLSRQALTGIALILVGALLLIAPGLVGVQPDAGLTFGVIAVLVGAGMLVLRLRDHRSYDGPDDGAVV
jgi:hypothetical protein